MRKLILWPLCYVLAIVSLLCEMCGCYAIAYWIDLLCIKLLGEGI